MVCITRSYALGSATAPPLRETPLQRIGARLGRLRHRRRLGQRIEPADVSPRPREPLGGIWAIAVRGLEGVAVTAKAFGCMPCVRLCSQLGCAVRLGQALLGLARERMPG